ncbi:undecaprenyldiphospho-muramoylpentapeptide beta-N-acetylglucosaminyltransferase [Fibrobacterales bacterium]|nr:undecaprenyldiphospho-muramoylpentapeptide beta-N-acetylglucosaminyltransferase [Fibrobacterales bacterium]
MKILFTCGGTGGHIFPAVAMARQFISLGHQVAFAARAVGMETRILPKEFEYFTIPASPLSRSKPLSNLKLPFKMWKSFKAAQKVITQYQPDLVIGTGGYVTVPLLSAAANLKIPFFIQEQNAFAGVANRLLGRFAKKIYLGSEAAEQFFPKGRSLFLGNPIREITDDLDKPEWFETGFKILILGGSQGAKGVNQRLKSCIDQLCSQNKNVKILWQCGPSSLETLKSQHSNFQVRVKEFLDNIFPWIQSADLIISRAGASTLSEILAFSKPSILIPYPYATGNHQLHNAQALEEKGAALVEEEKDENQLLEKIQLLISNTEKRQSMIQEATALARPKACKNIVDDIINEVQNDSK